MSKINFRMTASINEVKNMIMYMGDEITHIVMGQPGVGKSSILKMLQDRPELKNHMFCYVDITTKDVGDFVVPKIRTVDGNRSEGALRRMSAACARLYVWMSANVPSALRTA